ncbi:MAG: hypothetical protein GY754_12410, partial [bacterium]|nr:hypothetical protein [bacterium]
TTTTTALATTTTTDDGEQTIAEREAELIELIAAGATGPEEWVLVAARALAAEQLVLERPGEVNLLDYFTEDSPYLEETIRPGEATLRENGHHLDGLLLEIQSVDPLFEASPEGAILEVRTLGLPAVLRSEDGRIISDIPTGGLVSFLLTAREQQGVWRVIDRGSEIASP